MFTKDMVESPILGKLTWSQEVLIHNPHDTRQETALQLRVKHSHTRTHVSLICAIESPKPSRSSSNKAVCLQKGSVHAMRQCLDLDETRLDIVTFRYFLRIEGKEKVVSFIRYCSEVY